MVENGVGSSQIQILELGKPARSETSFPEKKLSRSHQFGEAFFPAVPVENDALS